MKTNINNQSERAAFVVTLLIMMGFTLSAADFVVDGIAYKTHSDGTTVGVTERMEWDALGNANYPNLFEANIPETVTYEGVTYTVTTIEDYAFSGSMSSSYPPLRKVVIPNTVTTIGGCAFASCPNLKSVTFGENVESLGEQAFSDCSSLESIDLPVKLTSIGSATFRFCYGLKSVSIGKNIKSIGADAFIGCTRLENIYCHLMNPAATTIEFAIFYDVPFSTCTLHVPVGTKSLYLENEIWNVFENIVEDIEPDYDSNAWITLSGSGYAVYVGNSFRPGVQTNPADMALTWSSSDESIAIVDETGLITGVSKGIALITVKGDAPSNPTATCYVDVRMQEFLPKEDVNSDGQVDIADLNQVINAMLGKTNFDIPTGNQGGNTAPPHK